jgi:hypothetical protein
MKEYSLGGYGLSSSGWHGRSILNLFEKLLPVVFPTWLTWIEDCCWTGPGIPLSWLYVSYKVRCSRISVAGPQQVDLRGSIGYLKAFGG